MSSRHDVTSKWTTEHRTLPSAASHIIIRAFFLRMRVMTRMVTCWEARLL